jgi:hypothetical protein
MVSLRYLVAGVALVAAPVIQALTPAQLAADLESLATDSQNLEPTANSITILNAPLIVINEGPYPACAPTPIGR